MSHSIPTLLELAKDPVILQATGRMIISSFPLLKTLADPECKERFSVEKLKSCELKESYYWQIHSIREDVYVHGTPQEIGDYYLVTMYPSILPLDVELIDGVEYYQVTTADGMSKIIRATEERAWSSHYRKSKLLEIKELNKNLITSKKITGLSNRYWIVLLVGKPEILHLYGNERNVKYYLETLPLKGEPSILNFSYIPLDETSKEYYGFGYRYEAFIIRGSLLSVLKELPTDMNEFYPVKLLDITSYGPQPVTLNPFEMSYEFHMHNNKNYWKVSYRNSEMIIENLIFQGKKEIITKQLQEKFQINPNDLLFLPMAPILKVSEEGEMEWI